MPTQPFFSIVIPTLNEETTLPHLLNDLAIQSYTDFEIIHVDGKSKDKTVEVASSFKSKLKIKSISVTKRNVSYQRNIGGQKARGQWILFMDADNKLPAYFLDGIRYQLAKNPEVDVFTTWITTDETIRKYKAIVKAINVAFELYDNLGKPVSFGAFIGVRKKIFLDIQFDEKQKVVEDCFFIQSVIDGGNTFMSFKEPQYVYSMRRIKKEGDLKMAYTTAKIQLRFLQGKTFDKNNYGYEMKGGGYYQKDHPSVFKNLHAFITEASQKQLQQARKQLKKFSKQL